jgi:hypothetical protein
MLHDSRLDRSSWRSPLSRCTFGGLKAKHGRTRTGSDEEAMGTLGLRRVRACGVAWLAAATLFGIEALLERAYKDEKPSYIVGELVFFALPFLVATIPVAALAWLVVVSTSGWRHRIFLPCLWLGMGAVLLSTGRWMQKLYGLDPPYGFYFAGGAMQLVGFAMPIVAAVWGVRLLVERRRATGVPTKVDRCVE